MDISNPIRTIAPSVDADVLRVLARTQTQLTGAGVAALAERSYAQVRNVLRRLVDHGLVTAERHGNAWSYHLNRAHVAAPSVQALATATTEVERRIVEAVSSWELPPGAIVVFGSFARRDGDAASDIDLLLVRPEGANEEAEPWRSQRYALARGVEAWSGNSVQILDLSEAELSDAAGRHDDLVAALRVDGRVLVGPDLEALVGPPGARLT